MQACPQINILHYKYCSPLADVSACSAAACCSPDRGDTLCCSHSSTRAPHIPFPTPRGFWAGFTRMWAPAAALL